LFHVLEANESVSRKDIIALETGKNKPKTSSERITHTMNQRRGDGGDNNNIIDQKRTGQWLYEGVSSIVGSQCQQEAFNENENNARDEQKRKGRHNNNSKRDQDAYFCFKPGYCFLNAETLETADDDEEIRGAAAEEETEDEGVAGVEGKEGSLEETGVVAGGIERAGKGEAGEGVDVATGVSEEGARGDANGGI